MDDLTMNGPTDSADRVARDFAAELAAASVGLSEASRILEDSVRLSSTEIIEECLAAVRAAECRVTSALFAWHDYLSAHARSFTSGSAHGKRPTA